MRLEARKQLMLEESMRQIKKEKKLRVDRDARRIEVTKRKRANCVGDDDATTTTDPAAKKVNLEVEVEDMINDEEWEELCKS